MSRSRIEDHGGEAGFSLVELLVAMTITLIVTGSIYGILAGGQKAFRREPERTEVQQNLRTSMDFIMRDIANAGAGPGCNGPGVCDGMTATAQVFTPTLDGQGPATPGGGNSDVIEMLYAEPTCQPLPVNLGSVTLQGTLTLGNCFAANPTAIVIVSNDSTTNWGLATGLTPTANTVTFAPTQPPGATATLNLGSVSSMSIGKLVRYEVCTVPGDTVPSLCRSETGGYTAAGAFVAAPDPTGGWQVIARGIEDVQVDYRDGVAGAAWRVDLGADAVDPTNWTSITNTITKEVRVTLSGRGSLTNIQGQTGPAGAFQTLRAQLISTGTPRAALFYLQNEPPAGSAVWSSLMRGIEVWS